MRVIFAGNPEVAIPPLAALLESEHEIVAVITSPSAPAGRGRKLKASAVAEFASENQLPLFEIADINSVESIQLLTEFKADAAAVVAFGQLLKTDVLSTTNHGWINLHFSLLPHWRGAAPVQHAILSGDSFTGASTFLIDAGMDTGPVIGQLTTEISSTETAGELLGRLSTAGADLLVQSLDLIATRTANPQPQSGSDVSYASKILVQDAQINWAHPALAISRKIRAYDPSPFAWSNFNQTRVQFRNATIIEATEAALLAPGEIKLTKQRLLVGTGSAPIQIGEVKAAGKGWMSALDWARGVRTENWCFHD